jgi:hypothetical protein
MPRDLFIVHDRFLCTVDLADGAYGSQKLGHGGDHRQSFPALTLSCQIRCFFGAARRYDCFFCPLGSIRLWGWQFEIGVPEREAAGMTKHAFLLSVVVLFLFLGMFMDTISMLVVTMPFLHPIAESLGINPILFAVIIFKLLEIAAVSPPFRPQSVHRVGRQR